MFSKKKKMGEAEANIQTIPNPTQNKFQTNKDNYGDEDNNGLLINEAGKVGKAQHNFFRQSQKIEVKQSNRAITAEQLSKHTTADSAWLSLNGTVYDVTTYIKYHPGGRLILKGCGTQCIDLFNKYHAWVNGQILLKKYKLGYLT